MGIIKSALKHFGYEPVTHMPNSQFNFKASSQGSTKNNNEQFNNDYIKELDVNNGVSIWERMRGGDPEIAMLLAAIKNPIKSAKWVVEPIDDTDEAEQIAQFAEWILFDNLGNPGQRNNKTRHDFLHEALTCLEFGHSVFEVVHKVQPLDDCIGSVLGISA